MGGKDLSSCHTLVGPKTGLRGRTLTCERTRDFIKLTKAGDLCPCQQPGASEVSACEKMIIVGWSPINRNKL